MVSALALDSGEAVVIGGETQSTVPGSATTWSVGLVIGKEEVGSGVGDGDEESGRARGSMCGGGDGVFVG